MRSIVVFGAMGGLTTVIHIAVGLLVHHVFGLSAFMANLVAFCVGFFVSYFGHRSFTFRSTAKVARSMPRFFVIAATSLILNQLIVYLTVNVAEQPYWAALAIMVAVVPTFTYVLARVWAFDDADA